MFSTERVVNTWNSFNEQFHQSHWTALRRTSNWFGRINRWVFLVEVMLYDLKKRLSQSPGEASTSEYTLSLLTSITHHSDCHIVTSVCTRRRFTCMLTSQPWRSNTWTHLTCCLLTAMCSALHWLLFTMFTCAPDCSSSDITSALSLQHSTHQIHATHTALTAHVVCIMHHKLSLLKLWHLQRHLLGNYPHDTKTIVASSTIISKGMWGILLHIDTINWWSLYFGKWQSTAVRNSTQDNCTRKRITLKCTTFLYHHFW